MCFPLAVGRNKISVVTAQPDSSIAAAHLLCGLGDLNEGWWRGWAMKMLNSHGFHVWSQRGGQAEQPARFQPGF